MIPGSYKSKRHLSIFGKNTFTKWFFANTSPDSLANLANIIYTVQRVSSFTLSKIWIRCIRFRQKPSYSICTSSLNSCNYLKISIAPEEAKVVWVTWALQESGKTRLDVLAATGAWLFSLGSLRDDPSSLSTWSPDAYNFILKMGNRLEATSSFSAETKST